MFKQLNSSGSGGISLDEFYSIYDANMLRWEAQFSQIPWFHHTWEPLQLICRYSHVVVTWPYFEHIICEYLLTKVDNDYVLIILIPCEVCYLYCFLHFKEGLSVFYVKFFFLALPLIFFTMVLLLCLFMLVGVLSLTI